MKTFLSSSSGDGTGRPPELLLPPPETKLHQQSRQCHFPRGDCGLVWEEGCSDPSDAGGARNCAQRSPPGPGKDSQDNQGIVLIRGSIPLKYCPPSCEHMAKPRAPGCRPDKGSLCSGDVLFMHGLQEQTSRAILLPPAPGSPPCLCAPWLWRRELQRGAGVVWDLLLCHRSDCFPSPG